MRVSVFSTKNYDKEFLEAANSEYNHELIFFETKLNRYTASLAEGSEAVCIFVNDNIDEEVIRILSDLKIKMIALRCAGYNNVDLAAAQKYRIGVIRVPAYSPHSVAEHTLALLLALNRKIYKAHNRIREGNFALEGLLGFDIHGKNAGLIGTGKIGTEVAKIMNGFGCNIYAYDQYENPDCKKIGVKYISLNDIFAESDIITLHCPLTPQTFHLINEESLSKMKRGVVIINTSRGALINTKAVIKGLKSGKIGYLGLDVYEEEGDLFFQDLSNKVIQDDVFARLITFPNVIITGHQGFFTYEALKNIAETTIANISEYEEKNTSKNEIILSEVIK